MTPAPFLLYHPPMRSATPMNSPPITSSTMPGISRVARVEGEWSVPSL